MRFDRWPGPLAVGGLLIALLAAPAAALDDPKPARPDTAERLQPREVAFTARVEPARARPGDTVTYAITAKVESPWHIYAHAAEQPEGVAAVPTGFDLFQTGGLEPSDEGWTASGEPTKASPIGGVIAYDYHEGGVTWSRTLRVPDDARPGTVALQGQVTFQLCTDVACKPPTRRTVEPVELTIAGESPQARLGRPADPIGPALAAAGSALLAPPQDAPQPQRRDSPPALQPKEATFTTDIEPARARPGETVNYRVTAKLAPTWHIYAYAESIPEGVAAVPTRFDLFGLDGLEPAGGWTASREPHEPEEVSGVLAYKYYEDEVTWTLPLKVPADASPGDRSVRTQIQFQICDPRSCKPPTRVTLPAAELTVVPGDGSTPAGVAAPGDVVARPGAATADAPAGESPSGPVEELASAGAEVAAAAAGELQEKIDQGLLAFMGWSALGGLVALLMPCVWPMIPVTVNFFVKQGQPGKDGQRRSTTGLAITYCLTIIVTFTLVGVLASAFFGAQAGVRIANDPWINLFVAGVLIYFGLGLLGFYEIRLPSFVLNASARNESRGGLAGVIFMALTLTITSFSCTVPVVGLLLVAASRGSYLYPVVGLGTFATVLALPFFALALAPGLLSRMPRSGDWMNTIKVVGGLVELGAAFKFINAAEVSLGANPEDAWIDSQVLLALWVVVCLVCGLYLLKIFRTDHDQTDAGIGPGRILFGTLFLAVALYFAPALFGYPPRGQVYDRVMAGLLPNDSRELSAEENLIARIERSGLSAPGGEPEAPPIELADSDDPIEVQRASSFHGVRWGLSYDVALATAKRANKPVLVDFTGVNCANCRLMEKSVMPRPEVVERLRQFVPVQLYTDRVPVDGLTPDQKLDLAERNLLLEVDLTNQQVSPLYVVLTPDERLVLPPRGGYIEPTEFVSYLDRALAEHGQIARTVAAR